MTKSTASFSYTIFLAVFLAMAGVPSAISAPAAESQSPEEPSLKLIAAIPVDVQPTYFKDKNTGEPSGFAVDVMNEMRWRFGFTVDYFFGEPWNELIDMVRTGQADLVTSLTISPEREGLVAFTDPIEIVPVNLVVTADSRITGMTPGLTVGVIAGSIPEKILKKDYPSVRIEMATDFQSVLFELLAGHIDAAFVLTPNLLQPSRSEQTSILKG